MLNSGSSLPATEAYVHADILSAMFQAFETATPLSGLKVEVLMETGSHYILPSTIKAYNHKVSNRTYVDMTNPLFELVVRPLKCGEKLLIGFDSV